MNENERKEWNDLIKMVLRLNTGHHDLVKQSENFSKQLGEQSKRIVELYEKIDAKLNGE